jgi:hypothetical protein
MGGVVPVHGKVSQDTFFVIIMAPAALVMVSCTDFTCGGALHRISRVFPATWASSRSSDVAPALIAWNSARIMAGSNSFISAPLCSFLFCNNNFLVSY